MTEMMINALVNGPDISYLSYQKIIKETIWRYEIVKWKVSCGLYSHIDTYQSTIHNIEMHPWWHVANDNPHLVRKVAGVMSLLMSAQPLGLQHGYNENVCSLCGEFCKPDPRHVIFRCQSLEQKRQQCLQLIVGHMPPAMKVDFLQLSDYEKVTFLLSGMNAKYTPEWGNLYQSIAQGIYSIYSERACKIEHYTSH